MAESTKLEKQLKIKKLVIDMITVDYNKTLINVRILKLCIDDVKQIREDLSDERMYGEQVDELEFC